MTSRKASLLAAVLGYLLFVVIGCTKPAPPPPVDYHPLAATMWQVILVYNGGNCQQYFFVAPNPPALQPLVQIGLGDTVTWTARNTLADATPQSFDVKVAGSPFPLDFNSPNTPMTSQPASGASGFSFSYLSVSINNQACNNPAQLGLIMH